jgi:DNA-3-methyladenine glycosylase II
MVSHSTHLRNGIEQVKSICPHLKHFVEISDKCNLKPQEPSINSYFESLVRSVIAQQISSVAAATITQRVRKLTSNKITPRVISNRTEKELRSVGLSASKIKTIQGLANAHLSKEINLADLTDATNDEAVKMLSSQWGIGRWTSEMFLMFTLGRLDIWPVGDLAVRRGWQIAHGLKEMPNEKQMEPLGNPFAPYRSIAAWYCWRVLEPEEPW